MKRLFLLALIPLALSALLLAQPHPEASPRSSIESLASAIQSELESHGNRVLGDGLYSWSTRLNKIDGCRAELLVQVQYNRDEEVTFRSETVTFALGAIEPYDMDLQKNWLDLPCAHKDMCIFSTSTCSTRTRSGVVMDCAAQSGKRAESFRLEFDGDDAAAARLEKSFRQAVDLCHVPEPVTF